MTPWNYITAFGGAVLALAVIVGFIWIAYAIAPENAMALTAPGYTR